MTLRIVKLVGLVSLVSFTTAVVAMALLECGALVYYYEPNPLVLIAEVALGLLGIAVGLVEIWKIARA